MREVVIERKHTWDEALAVADIQITASITTAFGKSKTVGILDARIYSEQDYARIVRYSVHPKYRMQHIGKRMWERLLEYVGYFGSVSLIKVTPKPSYDLPTGVFETKPPEIELSALCEFYRKLGFTTDPFPFENGVHLIYETCNFI